VVEHEGLAAPDSAPLVGRDEGAALGDLDPGAADPRLELPTREPGRDRVEALTDADPGLAVDPDGRDPREVEGLAGQRRQRGAIGLAHRADGLPPAPDVAGEVAPVGLLEPAVEVGEALDLRDGHEEAPALAPHLALDQGRAFPPSACQTKSGSIRTAGASINSISTAIASFVS